MNIFCEVNCEMNIQKEQLHRPQNVPYTLKRRSCDLESENHCNVNSHVKRNHSFGCKVCDLIFKNEVKLQTHMFRITDLNPTYVDLVPSTGGL